MGSDEAKTQAILKAALELFVERGFHGTPVPEIAERAGVGAGTIYRAFANKEALVNALYRTWKQALVTYMTRDFDPTKPAREQFRSVWERTTDFALEHPRELAFLELHHHGSYLDAESLAVEATIHEFGTVMVRQAQKAQALKPLDPVILIELTNGAFLGVFRAAMEGRIPLEKKTFMAIEQCCWEAIRS